MNLSHKEEKSDSNHRIYLDLDNKLIFSAMILKNWHEFHQTSFAVYLTNFKETVEKQENSPTPPTRTNIFFKF